MVKKNDIETERKVFAYFKEAIGNSRVVALGECAHFVREFWQLREQLFEFLYEELGFNFFAMEFGFAEGFHLEKWINGEGESDKLSKYSEAAAKWGALNTMHWLRAYNEKNNNKIRFAGAGLFEITDIMDNFPFHVIKCRKDKG